MKKTGIILIIFGCISTLGAIIATINKVNTNFSGLGLMVLGIFFLNQANKKKEEEEKKKQWEQKSNNNDK